MTFAIVISIAIPMFASFQVVYAMARVVICPLCAQMKVARKENAEYARLIMIAHLDDARLKRRCYNRDPNGSVSFTGMMFLSV